MGSFTYNGLYQCVVTKVKFKYSCLEFVQGLRRVIKTTQKDIVNKE